MTDKFTAAPTTKHPTPGRIIPCATTFNASTINKDRACAILEPTYDKDGKQTGWKTKGYMVEKTMDEARASAAYTADALNEKRERERQTQ